MLTEIVQIPAASEAGEKPASGPGRISSREAYSSTSPSPTRPMTGLTAALEEGGEIDPDKLLLAVTYMEDAMAGKTSLQSQDPTIVKSYRFYHAWYMYYLLSAVVILHNALIFFEKPNGSLNTLIPTWATCGIEIICIVLYTLRIVHYKSLMSAKTFWKDRKNVVLVGVVCICAVDTLQYLIVDSLKIEPAVRFSRILRPLVYINFADFRQVRRGIRSMRKTIVGVMNVIILLLMSIALFMLLFVKMFQFKGWVDKNGKTYFVNYSDAFFELYVLMTSANFPDVMMPAVDHHYGYAFVFMIFILLSMYIFLSVVLAVVYNDYRKHLKSEIKDLIITRRDNLRQAYHALKLPRANGVTYLEWKALVNTIRPSYTRGRVLLLWRVLDDNDNGDVNEHEFLKAADVLNVNLEMSTSHKNVWTKNCPQLYASSGSMMVRKMVESKLFSYFFNLVIFVNVVIIAADNKEGSQLTRKADAVFLTLFTLEILLKNWTYGVRNYFRSGWNTFDFLIVVSCLFVLMVTASKPAALGNSTHPEEQSEAETVALEFLMILRVLRLVKVIGLTERFRVVVHTIWNIKTAVSMYGTILVILYYMFAVVGMEIFAGKIYEGNRTLTGSTFEEGSPFYIDIHSSNPMLEGSEFAADGYYANNFNDPLSAFVTLFELMVVNQWHVLTEGHVLLTDKSKRIFFVCFHMITVVLILNIFIAFVIEAFVLQLEYENSEVEGDVERKIDAEIQKSPSLKAEFARLSVAKKSARTEVFLQRMFEAEILPQLQALEESLGIVQDPSRLRSNDTAA